MGKREVSEERVRKERDLYRRLLDLGRRQAVTPFLEEALALVVDIVEAHRGYMELVEPGAGGRSWSTGRGLSDKDVAEVRGRISRGIIASAIAAGETIYTDSARLDPRFQMQNSVRMGRIEAVLCTPVGRDVPLGVVYLQGRRTHGLFSPDDIDLVETFARHLAPLADRLVHEHAVEDRDDPTRVHRARLKADGLVGRSRALASLLQEVALVAPLDVSVLVTGPTGCGKSAVARCVHESSARAHLPFVELNCAALPETLLESELFGYERGAFTGADRARPGKVAAAEGGTLFLDEVAEIPMGSQAKLLQLLQSSTYFPLGSNEPLRADIRIIAATNAELREEVAAKRFREDLLYRLEVLPVRVPGLDERRDDIAPLAQHFCAAACARHRLPALAFSPGALQALEHAEWPGNVRQLAHVVQAAAIRAAGEGTAAIAPRHVMPGAAGESGDDGPLSFQEATRRFQRELVTEALDATDWNITEAARRLDVHRSFVYKLIRAHDIRRK